MSTPLPRRSLAWLLFALVLAIGPHALRLPPWVLVVMGVAIAWRYRVYQGAWSFPGRAVKLLLVVMSFLAVGLHWRALSGLEPAVALLAIAGGLKAMEMRTTRDFLVVVFVAYFLVASQLLFEQEIPYALYAVVATAGVTAAMVARHQGDPAPGFPHPLVLTGKLLAQAVPVMLLLFVVFPRIAPLWAIPQNTQSARTGPSDSMSPGDVARLSGSNALALRATFEGAIPAQRELYWRGLVFSEFDGRQWRQGAMARMEAELAQQGAPRPALRQLTHVPSGEETSYEVILEPSNQPWAYVIGFPLSFDANLRSGSDYRLMSSRPLTQRLRYRVRADLGAQLEPELGILRRRTELQLPEGFNPRALAQAKAWRAEAPSDAAYIERVLRWFTEEEFVYTMSPPLLGRDSVDQFLFGERRGFCEHYASAFAVLLRAAGIPARVVVGYQGGERNPYQAYLLVHQFDAHAWAEVWIEGRGWVRVDPTGAVSPGRIGAFTRLRAPRGAFGSAVDSVISPGLAQQLRAVWEAANNRWNQWVLNYTQTRQLDMLKALGFDAPDWQDLVNLLAGLVAAAALGGAAWSAWERLQHDPWLRLLALARKRLARAGLALPTHLPPRAMAEAVRAHFGAASEPLAQWLLELEALRYAAHNDKPAPSLKQLRRRFATLALPTPSA